MQGCYKRQTVVLITIFVLVNYQTLYKEKILGVRTNLKQKRYNLQVWGQERPLKNKVPLGSIFISVSQSDRGGGEEEERRRTRRWRR